MSDDLPAASHNEFGQPIGFPMPRWTARPLPSSTAMTGRHCLVVPLNPTAHADEIFDAFAEDHEGRLWTYMAAGPFPERASFDGWLADCHSSRDPLFYAVLQTQKDAETARATGIASFMRIAPAVGVIEVGNISFAPRLQRTVAATEAMYLMMHHAFEALGYRRYEWKCDSLNAASRRAAERLGFTFEGVFRQAIVYKGRNRDTAWYSIVDCEWPAVRQALESWLASDNFDAEGRQCRPLAYFMGSARSA